MAPPSTPSFMKTQSSSLTHVTNLQTPTFLKSALATQLSDSSDTDTFPIISAPMVSLAESENTESDEILHDISSKTLIMDNNFNYLDSNSEVTDNTPIIEALPSMDETSPSNSSSSSSGRMSSDGYPKSDDSSSDNQIVPECYDLDKEFMSRLQYYSDFTLDRQKKINTMVSHLVGAMKNEDVTSADTEELFTRHVEGAESPVSPVKLNLKQTVTSGSSSDYLSTPPSKQRLRRERSHRHSRSSRKSSSNPLASSTRIEESYSSSSSSRRSHAGSSLVPKASSTMIDDTFSLSSGSSGRRNRTGGSNPRACSTMLNETFLSSGSANSHGSSRQRSIPMANSTMISEANAVVPSIIEPSVVIATRGSKDSLRNSDDDLESIYTWSIHDDDGGSDTNMNLEQSYMRNITNSQKKGLNNKPPLPPSKRARSGSVSSRDSETSLKVCQDQNLHKLLGETCSKDILETISAIEPNAAGRDEALLVESLYDDDDECALPRANTIPRSSTKMNLKDKSGGNSSSAKGKDKSSGSSSMEAHRASLPNLYSVCVDDFHSVPDSLASDSDDDDISVLPERMRVPGKSSSSGEKDSSVSISQLDSSKIPVSPGQEVVKDTLIDSILTDSPNSVSSGGINAPHNSPGTNCSSSSKVSCSTTSDAKSSDSNINTRAPQVTLLPRNIVESPKLQNIKLPQASGEFKVPKQTQPLRKLFRFRRNKSKTPDLKISVPRQEPTVLQNDPQSKRELFPGGATDAPHEPKLVDKKAVIKKFKKFSDNFHKRDRSGRVKIETLANL